MLLPKWIRHCFFQSINSGFARSTLPFLQNRAQRDIQKTFNKYQISLTNTKYCLTHKGDHVLLKWTFFTGEEQHFRYPLNMGYIPIKRVILNCKEDLCRIWYAVLYCSSCWKGEEHHIWLEECYSWLEESSYAVPFLYIPHTFHIPLSPP